jgi:hypothetical protein
MSNAERQRRFRASHPGYNRKYNGHPSAAQRRAARQTVLEAIAKAEAEIAAQAQSSVPVRPFPLMLPAPVVSQPATHPIAA